MNQDESESPTILQKIKQCKSTESFKNLVTQIGLEPILECISGSLKKIPLDLLKQRPEVFDDTEFLNRFLEIFEGFLEEVALGDIIQDETLEEILSILLKDNKNQRLFLDAIIRSDPIVLYRTQDDAKEKLVSNPAFQEGVAKNSWEYSDIFIIDCARYPDFTKSKLINDAVEKQKEIILKEVQSGFYISEVGVSYPWDIYWLSQYPSLETEILDIMEKVKACVAHACYVEGMYYEGEYTLPHPTKVVERIIDISIFLQDQDIQLGRCIG